MQTIIRLSALATLLATAGCISTTTPAPAYVTPTTVTTVPPGTTVIVPRP